MENVPFFNTIAVDWDEVEELALPMSTPDFRAKKESNNELLGVAANDQKLIINTFIFYGISETPNQSQGSESTIPVNIEDLIFERKL